MNNKRYILIIYIAVVVIWGANWPITKIIVQEVPPLWTILLRSAIGAGAVLLLQIATKQFVIPKRQDMPIILIVGIFHVTVFSVLMAVGIQYVSAGRSAVLAYTTPLWVAPAAWLLLKEPMPRNRIIGIIIGLCGLIVLFNPIAMDWTDKHALFGNALLMSAAIVWTVAILYNRVHVWHSSPFQLVFWQLLLSTIILAPTAYLLEGVPHFTMTVSLAAMFAYNGLLSVAFGFWAISIVNKSLPATVTSLGLLATPVVGIISSTLILGERVDLPLAVASAMIIGGIALGNLKPPKKSKA